MKKRLIFLIILIFSVNILGKNIVTYPNIHGLGKKSFGYEVLKLALGKVDSSYEVVLMKQEMNSERAKSFIESGVASVSDGGLNTDDSEIEYIYKPIDMGLLGWRIFIINKELQSEFHKIKTLKELRSKSAGQGEKWTDRYIIEKSGIKVITSTKIEFLVNMVNAKRFDFFPLGANEAHGFLHKFGENKPNLVIEDSLALVYPFGRFFFVKKGNKKLKDDISLGLDRAFEDGSFQNLLFNHPFFKEGLEKSELKNRTIIRINNPFLPEEFYSIDPKWWYKVSNL